MDAADHFMVAAVVLLLTLALALFRAWFDLVPALLYIGVFFYAAGSLGLLRFQDAELRLHALTKADNVGLGFKSMAVA